MRILEDRRPEKPEVVVEETRYVESDAKLMQRLLGREVGGKQNILVLNDEAHHAYRIRGKAADEAEDDAEALVEERATSSARVDGLDRRASTGSTRTGGSTSASTSRRRRTTSRAPARTRTRIFPWVVSDFGLTDAIESGLVKIPQLAHSDPTGRGAGGVLQHLALDHEQAHGRPSAAASARIRSPRRC